MATLRGARSCSSSSVAWIMGSAWNRVRMIPSRAASAMATMVMPWWCAMNARTTASVSPAGMRPGV